MPAVKRGPPDPSEYNYMLARFDWSPRQSYLEAIYGESKRSRSIEWPEPWGEIPNPPNALPPSERRRAGVRQVCAIFVTSRHLRDRLLKLGWRDFTDEWSLHLNPEGVTAETTGQPLGGAIFSTAKAVKSSRHAA